jgi:hypothetical protein
MTLFNEETDKYRISENYNISLKLCPVYEPGT